jgi:SAM-dependent methyltransferase
MTAEELRYFIVKKIYADHNDSSSVRVVLADLLAAMPPSGVGLNVGAGKTRLDARIRNMELLPGDGIDYVGSVEKIPAPDQTFDLVIAQEVLEHVKQPRMAVAEIHRVLKSGGVAYVQLPFIIGYHPCPADYWRFTDEGIVELMESADFEMEKVGASVGPAVGFYRILVEFLSIAFSFLFWRLYRPLKLLFSVVLYPIKLLDPLLIHSREARRIMGGHFIVCRKR